MKLWTVWQDYHATGEGRTLMARIGYAESAQEALADFGREFDPYFARGVETVEGIDRNEITLALFAPTVLKEAQQMEGRVTFVIAARFHFNYS